MKQIQLSQLKLPRLVWVLVALVPLLTWATAAARSSAAAAKAAADGTYVRRDTFDAFRSQLTVQDAVRAGRDAWRDSVLAQLYRACQHDGKCP